MHILRTTKLFFLFFLLSTPLTYAYQVATGSVGIPNISTAFDRANSIWYLGQIAAVGDAALIKVGPFNGINAPTALFIGTNTDFISNYQINFLTLSQQDGTPIQRPSFVTSNVPTAITICSSDGSVAQQSDPLNDANGAGNPTSGIVGLAASPSHIFAAVSVKDGDWGDDGSGITYVAIDNETLELHIYDVTTGTENGNKALPFNAASFFAADYGAIVGLPVMHWNNDLQKIYVGIEGKNFDFNHSFASVSCFYVDTINNILTNVSLVTDGFTDGAATGPYLKPLGTGISNIIGLTTTNGTEEYMAALNISTMKTSTGRYYLIVNGGYNGTDNPTGEDGLNVGNQVWALPLVGGDNIDFIDPDTVGSLARVIDPIIPLIDFTMRAQNGTQLFTNIDIPAIIGSFTLPMPEDVNISHMEVVGDAVYVSFINTDNHNAGVYYSQALFNSTGAISGWTAWTRAISDYTAGPDIDNGACLTFAIDAARGTVWTLPDLGEGSEIRVAQWTNTGDDISLAQNVNRLLNSPCYCVLDVNEHTANVLNQETTMIYALFGGQEKVVAVQTLYASGYYFSATTSETTYGAPQSTTMSTKGLEGAGAITCLQYTRIYDTVDDVEQPLNFIMAGSNQGLYILSSDGTNTGTGFSVNGTNAAPAGLTIFNGSLEDSYSWYKHPQIKGEVKKIATIGNNIYVLVCGVDGNGVVADRIYSAKTGINVSSAGDFNFILIAQAGVDNLPGIFNDMQTIGAEELSFDSYDYSYYYSIETINDQLMLATNNGIWATARQDGLQDAISQADAAWYKVPFSDGVGYPCLIQPNHVLPVYYNEGIAAFNTNNSTTLWPTSWTSTKNLMFNRSVLNQISMGISADNPTFNPVPFNSDSTADLLTFLPQYTFWSNGGMRFLITVPTTGTETTSLLQVVPYNVGVMDWNMTTPFAPQDPIVMGSKHIYWLQNVGGGYILAGTENGVISLQ